MGPPSPATARAWLRDLLCLAALFGALYGFVLGRAPLDNPDEGRYAEIPREMLASGDWVTPKLDGVNYFEKPPLVYWCVAASIAVFGRSEWALRLTPALFGVGGVLLTYAAARRLFGRPSGLISAAVLGTSLLYAGTARVLVLDTAVSVLMSATLFCFLLAVREPPGRLRRWFFWGLYASAALATLTKGLIGFLLTGLVMFLWLLLFNQWRRLRPMHLPSGLAIFLAIATPWHVLVALRNPTWARFYLLYEHWERFTTKSLGRYQPPWFFVPVLVAGLFPWTGFLWQAARRGLEGAWKGARAARSNAPSPERDAVDRAYLVVWSAAIFLFFSASDSKLIGYILPLFPAAAVLIGDWLAALRGSDYGRRVEPGLIVFCCFCLALAGAGGVAVAGPKLFHMDPIQAGELHRYVLALAAVVIAGAFAATTQLRRRRPGVALAAVSLTGAGVVAVAALATPWIYKPDTKPLALLERRLGGPSARVYSYRDFFHDFCYYAERTVVVVDDGGELEPENDPAAVREGRFIDRAEFLRQWRGPGLAFVVGRRKDLAPLMQDKDFHYRLIGRTEDHYLLSNRPPPAPS